MLIASGCFSDVDSTGDGSSGGDTSGESSGGAEDGALVLFYSENVPASLDQLEPDGDARGTADLECQAQAIGGSDLDCAEVRAVISIGVDDTISRMDTNYFMPFDIEVQGPDGVVVADSFAAMLQGTLQTSLEDANVQGTNSSEAWWSGSEPDGSLAVGATCVDWKDTRPMFDAQAGSTSATDENWVSDRPVECAEVLPLLCACWSADDGR